MVGQFAAVGIGAALGAWLRWGLVDLAQSEAARVPARHARLEPDRRLSGRLRGRVLRVARGPAARVAPVRDHRRPRRTDDVLDLLGRSDRAPDARRLRERRNARVHAPRRLARADVRRLRNLPTADPITETRNDPRHSHPQDRRTRGDAVRRGRRARAGRRRSARAAHGDRRQLHRYLSPQRAVSAADALGHRQRGGGRRRGGRTRRRRSSSPAIASATAWAASARTANRASCRPIG